MGFVVHGLTPERGTNAGTGGSTQRHPGAPLEQGWLAFAQKVNAAVAGVAQLTECRPANQKVNAQLLLCSEILLCVRYPH